MMFFIFLFLGWFPSASVCLFLYLCNVFDIKCWGFLSLCFFFQINIISQPHPHPHLWFYDSTDATNMSIYHKHIQTTSDWSNDTTPQRRCTRSRLIMILIMNHIPFICWMIRSIQIIRMKGILSIFWHYNSLLFIFFIITLKYIITCHGRNESTTTKKRNKRKEKKIN